MRYGFTPHKQMLLDRKDYIRNNPDWINDIINTSGMHYYKDSEGNVGSINDWMRRMTTFIFHPVSFSLKDEHGCSRQYFVKNLSVPAFSEKQAYDIADVMIKTFDGLQCFDHNEDVFFDGYETPLKLRNMRMPVSMNDFTFVEQEPEISYPSDGQLTHMIFLFDFATKYGFERGLKPVGEPVKYLRSWYREITPYFPSK